MASLNHLLSVSSNVWVYWHELSYPAALSTLDMFKLTKMIRLPSFAGWGTKPGLSSDDDQGLGRGSLLTSFVTPALVSRVWKFPRSPRITLTWICAIFGISQHFWDDGCFPKWFRAEFGLFSRLWGGRALGTGNTRGWIKTLRNLKLDWNTAIMPHAQGPTTPQDLPRFSKQSTNLYWPEIKDILSPHSTLVFSPTKPTITISGSSNILCQMNPCDVPWCRLGKSMGTIPLSLSSQYFTCDRISVICHFSQSWTFYVPFKYEEEDMEMNPAPTVLLSFFVLLHRFRAGILKKVELTAIVNCL